MSCTFQKLETDQTLSLLLSDHFRKMEPNTIGIFLDKTNNLVVEYFSRSSPPIKNGHWITFSDKNNTIPMHLRGPFKVLLKPGLLSSSYYLNKINDETFIEYDQHKGKLGNEFLPNLYHISVLTEEKATELTEKVEKAQKKVLSEQTS